MTGPLVGGVVLATVALLLAGQFRREAYPAAGFLTGAAMVRRGERMAWIGIALAATAVVAAVVVGAFQAAWRSTGYGLRPAGGLGPPPQAEPAAARRWRSG